MKQGLTGRVRVAFAFAALCGGTLGAAAPVAAAGDTAGEAPRITAVEPPAIPAQAGRQTIVIRGSGFQPGALLKFENMTRPEAIPLRPPASVRDDRIERRANFGEKPARWQVTVVNPDGSRTEPFEFAVGLAARPPATAQAPEPEGSPPQPPAESGDAPDTEALAEAPPENPLALLSRPTRDASPVATVDGNAPRAVLRTVRNALGAWSFVRVGREAGWVLDAPAPKRRKLQPQRFAGTEYQGYARYLLAVERPDEAYRYLDELEIRFAGDPDFDYLHGLSALDSGRPAEAVFSFQRCLSADENFAGARIELARAYFELGDNEDARREFQVLRGQNPPPKAQRVIERYLEAVDARATRYRPYQHVGVEAGGGYDTNVNGGPNAANFLTFALAPDTRQTGSYYYGLSGEYAYLHPISPSWRWQAGASGSYREHSDAHFVDAALVRGAGGMNFEAGPFTLTTMLAGHYGTLDDESNNYGAGVDLGTNWDLSPRTFLASSGRVGVLRYAAPLHIQDVEQYLVSAGLGIRGLATPVTFEVGPAAGIENALQGDSPYGRELVGGHTSLRWIMPWQMVFNVSGGWLRSQYEGVWRFFTREHREDEQWTAMIGLDIPRMLHPVKVRLHAGYTDNRSNILLYDYRRYEGGVRVGWDF